MAETVKGPAADEGKASKQRSPSYPFISLEEAIARARTFWEKENKNAAAVADAAKHWSYKEKSSGALLTVSALKQYGFLEDVGSGAKRRIKLTELAKRILLDEIENSPERADAIKQAALSPKLFAEFFTKWGTALPSDESFRTYLRLDRGFTEAVIPSVISDYKATLLFAKLANSDKMSQAGGSLDTLPAGGRMEGQQRMPPLGGDYEPVRIALEGGGIGRVIFSGSVATPDDIAALIEVLEVQKRQLERKAKAAATN